MAERTGPDQPKYLQIADALRAAIESGQLKRGDRLPGENALAEQHNVASLTARKAIKALADEGLLETKRGAAPVVNPFTPIRRRGIPRLSRDQWGAGRSVWTADEQRSLTVDMLHIEKAAAPQHIAEVLGLGDNEDACVRSRRYVLDGRPVMLAVSYLPYDLVEGSAITLPDTGPGGVYARLADLNAAPAHFREEIRGRLATADEALRLATSPGRPVVKVSRTAFSSDGRAVEINVMTLDAASYVLEYEFDA